MSIRKAVLPVAGLGTRFLPATKAQPKEMLPIVDKPLVQYAVEEVAASGIPMVIFVTGRGKPKAVSAYGIIHGLPVPDRHWDGRLFRIDDMVEKPAPRQAPSNLAIIGRYILTPAIFKELAATRRGTGGEIQLTDGLRGL